MFPVLFVGFMQCQLLVSLVFFMLCKALCFFSSFHYVCFLSCPKRAFGLIPVDFLYMYVCWRYVKCICWALSVLNSSVFTFKYFKNSYLFQTFDIEKVMPCHIYQQPLLPLWKRQLQLHYPEVDDNYINAHFVNQILVCSPFITHRPTKCAVCY